MAANYARFVAAHTPGSDHNEAVLLWESIPKASRGEGPELGLDLTGGAQVRHGRLTAVTCSAIPGARDFTVTLQPDEAAAPALTLHTNGNIWFGFPDSFWWGRDHVSHCYHMADHPAMVTYKPSGPTGGELVDLQVSEDYPSGVFRGGAGVPAGTAHKATTTPAQPSAP